MSDKQFGRCARVTAYRAQPVPKNHRYVAGSRIVPADALIVDEQLEIEFDVEHTLEKDPNKCTIKIGNPSAESRKFLAQKPLTVRLEVGYQKNYRVLFAGDLFRGYVDRKNTDFHSIMQLSDGLRAHAFARVKRTWDRGVPVLTALRECAAAIGLELPPEVLADPDLKDQFEHGRTLYGSAVNSLTRLFAPYGITWSRVGDKMIALRDDEVLNQALVIDGESWLLSSPEFKTPEKPGAPATCKFETHVYPELFAGKKVQLNARESSALLKIKKVRHSGKTEGGDWKSEAEGEVIG